MRYKLLTLILIISGVNSFYQNMADKKIGKKVLQIRIDSMVQLLNQRFLLFEKELDNQKDKSKDKKGWLERNGPRVAGVDLTTFLNMKLERFPKGSFIKLYN